jgi:membrane protease YdiL (CAAX protease family)
VEAFVAVLAQFAVLFPPLHFVRFIPTTYLGYALQDTLRKLLIMFVLPVLIWIWAGGSLSVFHVNGGDPLAATLVVLMMLLTRQRWGSLLRLRVMTRALGTGRHLRAVALTFLIHLLHVGIPEEFLYRVFLIGVFTPWLGTPGAIVLSSVVFGLAHVPFMPGQHSIQSKVRQALVIHTTIGFLLALVWVKLSCFYLNVLLHAFYNSLFLSIQVARRMYLVPTANPEASGAG